ncbi:GNAT family N-acetyltransferase [Sphaerisporangium sp. TRM90804]|uniref:GNAT family N-acetyltransferase n=1 Tax=Sphaerisporangium sp. TRM90804 TaxID=3031113 RepID=UPI0024478DDA|nr:GNAT family N-acetyltransferase [Sphaerisporangium sp. TRM90804]MDH2425190.1 GNAT family N-acetyltransferase [Sphaerisporangium sp. TRM90804]
MADVGVRAARVDDVAAVTATQIRAWKAGYRPFLPEGPLEQMTGPSAEKLWARQWEEAVLTPPTPRHRLLVAVETDDPLTSLASGPGGGAQQVVGLASHGPAEDPDLDPSAEAELLTLLVDPGHVRRGHGSRLLNATVDHLREDGFTTVVTWVFAEDDAMLGFFGSAGWAPDEAERVLEMGRPIRMIRLATDIA